MPGGNSTYPQAGVSFFKMKNFTQSPCQRVAAKRYRQVFVT